MNKFVTGALALTAASSVGFANPSEESEWLELDSEINSLASAMTTQGPIGGWAVLVRGNYSYSEDQLITGAAGDDVSGFLLDDIRIAAWGEVGDYGWRVSLNSDGAIGGSGGTSSVDFIVEDAYVHFACTDYLTVMMGQYRPRVFRSNVVWEENQLFIQRTILGAAFDSFELGLGAEGTYEEFGWQFNVLNGSDGADEDHTWHLRVDYHLNGGAGDYEGAYGSGDDLVGTVGFSYLSDDVSGGDSMMWGIDANGSFSQIGFGFEVADFDDDLFASSTLYEVMPIPGVSSGLGIDGDSTPWTATVSYLINMEFEVGFRYQNTDNDDDAELWTLGVMWYQSGKNAHWNAEFTQVESDFDDANIIQIGYTVGGST